MIEITNAQIERVQLLLGSIKGGSEKALTRAIERGKQTVKSQTVRKLTAVYAITQKNIRAQTNIKMKTQKTEDGIVGTVSFGGYKIPLYRFDVLPKKPRRGTVRARLLKSGAKTVFEHAFVAEMKSGHIGVFERRGKERTPITQFMGLSTAQMAQNALVLEEVEKAAKETIDRRLEHEISRLLNGYGGKR